jgi:hypothetical protein
VNQPFAVQVDGVIRTLLNGQTSAGTRSAMIAAQQPGGSEAPSTRERALRDLISLALASPEFQRR